MTDQSSERSLRWGILSTGNIAHQFAAGLRQSRRGKLRAVASRSIQSAKAFAQKYEAPVALGDYQSLLQRDDVDAVYIGLPNTLHAQWTIAALQAGKHVLCEKPLAASEAEVAAMFAAADAAGRTLIEAFMYRTHPQTRAVRAALARGDIGPLRMIRASFCYHTSRIDDNIRFDPTLAGGALMDIGCYCLDFASLCAGSPPLAAQVQAKLHARGVDEMAAGTLRFADDVLASFICAMNMPADNTAYICGQTGYIEIPIPWKPPTGGSRWRIGRGIPPKMDRTGGAGAPVEEFETPPGMDLYAHEADAFAAAALDGRPPFMTAAESLSNMHWLDQMRRQAGVIA